MALELDRVHVRTKTDDGDERLTEINHYVLVQGGPKGHPGFYVQQNQIYGSSGDVVTDPPAWFWDEVRKLDPKALEAARSADLLKIWHQEEPASDPPAPSPPAPRKRAGRPSRLEPAPVVADEPPPMLAAKPEEDTDDGDESRKPSFHHR